VTEFGTGITAYSGPVGIAPGADGDMWFAQYDGDQVGRITTGVPSAPRTLTASPRDKAAVVSWVAPASAGAAAITHYRVTAAPGGRTCTTTGKHTCTVTRLKPHTAYRFRVTASNRYGTGPSSAPSRAIIVRV
jgi:streptogramin lyase